jgi:hypothetical protein
LDATNDVYPFWATWKSRERYLPSDFHTKAGFLKFTDSIKQPLPEQSYHHLELFALVTGLAIRDIDAAMVHDSDEVPHWVANSMLRGKHVGTILKYCPPKISETP